MNNSDEVKEKIEENANSSTGHWLKMKRLTHLQFILFGFAMMLGNRNFSWNKGLKYGYDTLLFDLFYAGSGYICMCLCMGEMSSALPFSGGIFGYVRAALGPFNGFLVASCEFVYCTTYIVVKTQNLMDVFGSEDSIDSNIYYALVVLIYGICLCLSLIGGKPVFILTSLIGFFTVSVLLIYFFGTLASVGTEDISYSRYGGSSQSLTWASVMAGRFYVGSQYSGIQYFPLLSHYLKDPRSQVPRMMIISCVVFILFSVFITLAAISQAPGAEALASADLPLKYGFARLFDVNIDVAKWIDIPCLFGVVFGFFYCSGKQLFAITQSGLLPSFLNATIPGVDTPYLCYTLAACVGAALNMYVVAYPANLIQIHAISLIATLYICVMCLIAYMMFRRKFSSMTRSFINPLGDVSAVYGIINYISSAIGLIFYNSIQPYFLAAFGIYLIAMAIFFWTYLVKNQKFSEEEKKMMFKAYLINANRRTRLQKKSNNHYLRLKNNKISPSSSNLPSDSKGVSSGSGVHKVDMSQSKINSTSYNFHSGTIVPMINIDHDDHHFIPHTNPVSPVGSLTDGFSQSNRPAEIASTTSAKIISFISEKIQTVLPAMNNMSAEDLHDYEQLAALASGGTIEESEQKALEVRMGIDVESAQINL